MNNYNVDDILEEIKRKRSREAGPADPYASYPDGRPPGGYDGASARGYGYPGGEYPPDPYPPAQPRPREPYPQQPDGYPPAQHDAYAPPRASYPPPAQPRPREPYPQQPDGYLPAQRDAYAPPRASYPPPAQPRPREPYPQQPDGYPPAQHDAYAPPRDDYRDAYNLSREEYARFLAAYGQARRETPRRQERYDTYGGAARRPSYPSEKFDTYIGPGGARRRGGAYPPPQADYPPQSAYDYDPYAVEPEYRAPQPPAYRPRYEGAPPQEEYRPAYPARETPPRAPSPRSGGYGYAPPAMPPRAGTGFAAARGAARPSSVAPPMPPPASPPPSLKRRTPKPSMDDLLENFGEGVGLGKGLDLSKKNAPVKTAPRRVPDIQAPPEEPVPAAPPQNAFSFRYSDTADAPAYPAAPPDYGQQPRYAENPPAAGYQADAKGYDYDVPAFGAERAEAYPAQEKEPNNFDLPMFSKPKKFDPSAFLSELQTDSFDNAAQAAPSEFSPDAAGPPALDEPPTFQMDGGSFGADASGFGELSGGFGAAADPYAQAGDGFGRLSFDAFGGGQEPQAGSIPIAPEAVPFDESELNSAATRMNDMKVTDPMRTPPIGHIPLAPEDTQDDVDYDEDGNIVHTVNSEEERKSILGGIRSGIMGLLVRLGLTMISFLTLVYFTLAYEIPDVPTMEFMFAEGDTMRMFLIINVVIIALTMLVNSDTIGGGLVSLCTLKADNDSLVSLALVASVIQGAALIISPEAAVAPGIKDAEIVIPLYFCVPVLGLAFNLLGKLVMMHRIRLNSRLACSPGEKYVMRTVKSEDFSRELSRGLPAETPEITYSVKTQYVSGFLSASYARDYAESLNRLMAFISLGASALVAALAYFLRDPGSVYLSLTVFSGLMAICAPFTCTLVGNLPMLRAALKLRKYDAVIAGYPVVEEYSNVKAVTFKAKDLFPEDSVSLSTMKVFQEDRIEQAILDAASVICATDSPLAAIFRSMINANEKVLKPVDNIVYEDSMGLSAWADGKRVLIGNAQLMRNHGINTPARDFEQRYAGEGKDVLYLSNSGELTALFALSYAASQRVSAQMQELAQGGVSLIVHTTDPNVTPKRIAQLFNYPEHYVKVVPANLHADYDRMTSPRTRARASIVYSGTVMSMFKALGAIPRIKAAVTLGAFCQLAVMLAGFALFTVFAFFPSLGELAWWVLLLYQTAGATLTAAVMNIRPI